MARPVTHPNRSFAACSLLDRRARPHLDIIKSGKINQSSRWAWPTDLKGTVGMPPRGGRASGDVCLTGMGVFPYGNSCG
jgi:hypothetical protein